jgi:glycosyltransferase involved in cell wall biosynthesis
MIALDGTVIRPPLSGVHYAVRNQVCALCRVFPETPFLVLATDEEIRPHCRGEHQRMPRLPHWLRRPGCRIAWQQCCLPTRLRREGCETLLSLAYTAPLRSPVPFGLQVHDVIALRQPELCSRLNAWHMRVLMPPSLRRAAWVLVSSTAVADQVMALSGRPASEIHRVALGVDPIFLGDRGPVSDLPARWRSLTPYILFVGNLEPKKGLDTLLSAYRECADGHQVTLVLAGRVGWKCRSLLRRIDRWSGPGRIVRLGYVPRMLLPVLYRQAAVCVMPSVEEGFGLPVLEAMACGVPVVHSDHPVLTETAGGHGHRFPVGDHHALARRLETVLAEPDEAASMAKAARDWARKHTWGVWAEAVGGLLQLSARNVR